MCNATRKLLDTLKKVLYYFTILTQKLLHYFLTRSASLHSVKSVRIWNFSSPYFSGFGLITERYPYSVRIRENMNQKNSEYGHFSRCYCMHQVTLRTLLVFLVYSTHLPNLLPYFLKQVLYTKI